MNKEYINFNEVNDYDLLVGMGLFYDLEKMPDGHYSDATGKTNFNGKTIERNIELKHRNQVLMPSLLEISGCTHNGKPYKDTTMMIEEHKYIHMLEGKHHQGQEPLYINFLQNGYVVIFNLRRMPKQNEKKKMSIYSKGLEKMENEDRLFLNLEYAAIYTIDGKLIRRANMDIINGK